MKAMRLHTVGNSIACETLDDPQPESGQVVVEIHAAALNRRDYWITQGLYPGLELPCTLGSDAAGIVAALGNGVDSALLGNEVVINPGMRWGDNPAAQAAEFEILGMPSDGTAATHCVVPAEYVHPRPPHLSWQEAAALPLAGVTAYRALFTQGRLESHHTLLVSGIGGGVATFALQYGIAAGANVVVTSSSPDKLRRACEMGAAKGYLYTDDDWHKQFLKDRGGADVIIDGAGGPGYGKLISVAAPAARIVNYGSTAGPPEKLDLFKVFWKQLSLVGSTMGSPNDFRDMLDFVNKHNVKPVVDKVYPLADYGAAIESMAQQSQFGKIVIDAT